MKYHKNRAAYDAKCGRTTPNNHAPSSTVIPPVVSKQTAFVATGHDAPLKRSRPSDFDNPDSPSQRPMRGRPRQSYAEDGNDSSLEGEDEIMEDGDRPSVARIHRPSLMSIPASSASGVPPSPSTVTGVDISSATSSTYPRQSYTPRHSFVTNGHSASPAPGGTTGAAWVTPFSAEDKAEALSFLVNRPQPVDLLDNVRSWVDFAEKVSPTQKFLVTCSFGMSIVNINDLHYPT
ncbi:hypothetical protein DL93DRAFT_1811980 [Clavulina sp. PMI_390]|nr:hypothetical protein DL93DRAFT_1811980 [Clavulina sp. PMI_390]